MKTQIELIRDVINDIGISEKHKHEERSKFDTCNKCPDKKNCWSCGIWEWWV